MSTVFVNIGLSLDGYMAPEGMTMENWDKPEYKNWGAKWGALMRWIFNQQFFRENLKLGPGGETGPVNDMLRKTTERIGANIMGKRMFEQGERAWPEEAPFHTPVYVLTHEKREPWVRPGGHDLLLRQRRSGKCPQAGSRVCGRSRYSDRRRRGRDPTVLEHGCHRRARNCPSASPVQRWKASLREPTRVSVAVPN